MSSRVHILKVLGEVWDAICRSRHAWTVNVCTAAQLDVPSRQGHKHVLRRRTSNGESSRSVASFRSLVSPDVVFVFRRGEVRRPIMWSPRVASSPIVYNQACAGSPFSGSTGSSESTREPSPSKSWHPHCSKCAFAQVFTSSPTTDRGVFALVQPLRRTFGRGHDLSPSRCRRSPWLQRRSSGVRIIITLLGSSKHSMLNTSVLPLSRVSQSERSEPCPCFRLPTVTSTVNR